MARKDDKKSKYQGPKLGGDTREYRDASLKRAQKNSQTEQLSNAVFALQDEVFKQACKDAETTPTPRQASKFRAKYGKAARAAGINIRKDPLRQSA